MGIWQSWWWRCWNVWEKGMGDLNSLFPTVPWILQWKFLLYRSMDIQFHPCDSIIHLITNSFSQPLTAKSWTWFYIQKMTYPPTPSVEYTWWGFRIEEINLYTFSCKEHGVLRHADLIRFSFTIRWTELWVAFDEPDRRSQNTPEVHLLVYILYKPYCSTIRFFSLGEYACSEQYGACKQMILSSFGSGDLRVRWSDKVRRVIHVVHEANNSTSLTIASKQYTTICRFLFAPIIWSWGDWEKKFRMTMQN